MRRRGLTGVLAALLLCGCGSQAQPPNVLIYVVDSLRADALRSYGNRDAATPAFDALAREGIVFERAFANSSWPRASLGSLLTGLLPWRHGAEDRDDRLPADATPLAAWLGRHGYRSALVTANPDAGPVFGFDNGFDETIELYSRTRPGRVRDRELVTRSDAVRDAALAWLEAAPQPFMLVVHATDPHAPYTAPRRFDPARWRTKSPVDGFLRTLDRADLGPDDRARIRELYQAEVAFADDAFADVLAHLRVRGLLDRTITILTSDHGEEFWEHGRHGHAASLSDEVLHVPLLLRYPGDRRAPSGGRTQRPIQLIDLVPSVLDLAGLPVPEGLDGRSFFASTLTRAVGGEEPILLAGLRLDEHRLLAARQGRRKLVWDLRHHRLELHDLDRERPEDLPLDPARDPEAAAAAARLRDALEQSIARAAARGGRDEAGSGGWPRQIEASPRQLGDLD